MKLLPTLKKARLHLLLLSVFFTMFSLSSRAQTTLAAGDIMFIGVNADLNTVNGPSGKDFCFVLLRDIVSGTSIYFTDFGWAWDGVSSSVWFQGNVNAGCASGQGAASDGVIQWTATSGMSAGTTVLVRVQTTPNAMTTTASSGTASVTGVTLTTTANVYMNFSTTSDQIFAYQGSYTSPTLIAAMNFGANAWDASVNQCATFQATNSKDPGSSVGGFAYQMTSGTAENGRYTGTTTGGAAALRTAILNTSNWEWNDGTGTPPTAVPFSFPPAAFTVGKLWAGTTNNWFTAGNWSPSGVPTGTDNVIIQGAQSAYPDISTGTGTVNGITIETGASVTVSSSGVLQIAGSITNNGTFSASAGGITFNGSTAQTLNGNHFNGGTANTIEDLVISNTAGVSISNALNIAATGSLTVNSGSTLTTGGNLTLVSNSSGTARVANSAGTISGNVNVQRYIPGGRRAFRFLSHPMTTTRALSELTDDIDITGTGGSLNGFTTTGTNTPSSFWYDQSVANGSTSADPGWTAFTSTNGAGSNGWQKGKGLLVLVRGAKTEGLNGVAYTPSAVTLDLVGAINQGSQIINISKGTGTTYYFTGNPFPSQIQMNQVTRGGGITSSYWYWDANQGTRGGYVNIAWTTSNIMPSWGGFITGVSSSSTLTFPESCKSTNTPISILKTTATENRMEFHLFSNNDSILWDRLAVTFDDLAKNDSDWYDGHKFVNPEVNFYTLSNDNVHLSLDWRPYKNGETIQMMITNAPAGNYNLKTVDFNLAAGTTASLHDKYLNKVVPLSHGTVYKFDITSDAATQNNRFELMLSGTPVTSVNTIAGSAILVEVAPNPAHDVVNLNYTLPAAGKAEVRVINVSGAVCRTIRSDMQTSGSMQIAVKDLPAGMYIVELTYGGEKAIRKFSKD